MCGIIGLFGDDTNVYPSTKRAFIQNGLLVDSLRGFDSTGIAYIPRAHKQPPRVYKKAIPGYDFIWQPPVKKLLDECSSGLGYIGHNRLMTKGNVSDETSHPFTFKHITLVHNGTVENAASLDKDWNKDCKVDSEHVAWAISEKGADTILPRLRGGYSLVWWDASDRTLHFARNEKKPMYWAFGLKENMLYFGSEIEMIMLCARRNAIALQEKMFTTTPLVHYVFKDPRNIRKFTRTPYKEIHYSPFPVSNYKRSTYKGEVNYYNPPYDPPEDSTWKPSKKTSSGGIPASTSTNGSNPPSGTPNHPIHSEVIEKKQAEEFSKTVVLDDARSKVLQSLAIRYHVPTTHHIPVYPYMWKPYKGESKLGVLYCRYKSTSCVIQVFDITLGFWQKLIFQDTNSPLANIIVKIINFRDLDHLNGYPPSVFVGEFNQKMTDVYHSPGTETKVQEGYKGEDGIEVGTSHKRIVSSKRFAELVAGGCANCGDPISITDLADLTWIGPQDDIPLCFSCGGTEEVLDKFAEL